MATNDVGNWLKLTLLLDKACLVLRQLFQKSWKSTFGHEWSGTDADIKTVLAQRQVQKIGKLQNNTILTGDVNLWELTTLRAILTSKSFLNLSAKESSDINCMAKIRNKLAHSASKGIPDDEFNALWCSVSAILVQFGELDADLELLKQENRVGRVQFNNTEEAINDESLLNAQKLKEAGNAQFRSENWTESIKIYTQAILLPRLPSADLATVYSNRSIAFLRQKELNLAMEDAKKTIELRPEWWRGHYRMGQVYTEMNKYEEAESCFDEALAREPHREEIQESRSYARMKGGQLERNDAIDAHLSILTLDDRISQLKSLTTSEVNANAMKDDLHAKVIHPSLQNWQDCQRGHHCQTGAEGFPRDYKLAAQYFKKAADQGSAEGLFELAILIMEGKGVKRDMKLGISMLIEAAEKPPRLNGVANSGVAEAEHALGLYYDTGIEVEKDELAAIAWYKRASVHGNPGAANNLGGIYRAKGDFVKAEQYYKMAANTGDAKAMLNLAGFYYCQFDPDSAFIWCQRARNAGMIGPEIDSLEKSCTDMIRTFNECGLKKLLAQNGEKSVTLRKEHAFRPALSDPARESLTKRLRSLIASTVPSPDAITFTSFSTWKPTKCQKSASSLIGLKAITLHEMDQQQDKVYNGYVLSATIIDDILFMASMQTIIEDSSGDVLMFVIYNWPNMLDKDVARKEFGIGTKISIVNPYMRMAVDGNSVIRIDDPASIIFDGFVDKMCRYCCEPNASKACVKCKASYCGKECQMLDWKRDHKLICSRIP